MHKTKFFSQSLSNKKLTQKPRKIRLIQNIQCKRVCRQDIIDRCTYIMQQVQNRNKINVDMISELNQYIQLFNEKITK